MLADAYLRDDFSPQSPDIDRYIENNIIFSKNNYYKNNIMINFTFFLDKIEKSNFLNIFGQY